MLDLDDLLTAIRTGDPAAFAQWMAGAEPTMRGSLRSFATRVDVEAVLQESLLRTWQIAPRVELDGTPNSLLRVGIRIARNLAVSEWRRARGVPSGGDAIDRALAGEPDGATLPVVPDPRLRQTIRECVGALPAQPARALQARLEGAGRQDDDDLAQQIGMRKNTFLQNFTRARKLIAECLKRRGVDLELELA